MFSMSKKITPTRRRAKAVAANLFLTMLFLIAIRIRTFYPEVLRISQLSFPGTCHSPGAISRKSPVIRSDFLAQVLQQQTLFHVVFE